MQLGERWRLWQLFVQMKDAHGRELLKNLRYMFLIFCIYLDFEKKSILPFADIVGITSLMSVSMFKVYS